MDLNYLFARQQISLMKAGAAHCIEARRAHMGLAGLYARRIDHLRSEMFGADRSVFL